MTDVTVETIVDRAQILDCVHRYTRGMDRLDRKQIRHQHYVSNHSVEPRA
jgi:hypothetical protein